PGQHAQEPVRRKLHILVVEDERGVREFLSRALTGLGHRVRVAADGNEGVAAIREESVDVVLTDLGLPGLRGDEGARAVAERRPGGGGGGRRGGGAGRGGPDGGGGGAGQADHAGRAGGGAGRGGAGQARGLTSGA